MGLLRAVNKKLNKMPVSGKRGGNTAQFLQATRARANEAREKLRAKEGKAAPQEAKAKPPPSSALGAASAGQGQQGGMQAPPALGGAQGRADPLGSARKRTAAPGAAPQLAAQRPLAGGSVQGRVDPAPGAAAAQVAKDMREVASGPRGGKYVSGPEGSKHYVK